MTSRRVATRLLPLVVTLWAGAFIAIKILLRHVDAMTIALVRFSLTTVGLWLVMAVVRPPKRKLDPAHRPTLVVMGLTGVAGYSLALNYGERFISANTAPLVIASVPVCVAILAYAFLGERIGRAGWIGIGLAFAGVVVLVVWGTPGSNVSVHSIAGTAVTAIAPISWAIYTTLSKKLVGIYGALPLSTWALTLGTVLLAPFAIVPTINDLGNLTPTDWLWLAFLAFGCTVFAYVVWFRALEVMDASRVAAWIYLVPPLAFVWAWIVLGESITPFVLVGGALVLVGVWLTERIDPRSRRPSGFDYPKKTWASP